MLALLQFDSAALPLLERLLGAGRLPTLDALRRQGRWVTLDATATILQSSTYMSLCTGVDVTDHGVYSAVPWCATDQRPRFMYDLPHPPTIWDRLTTAGRRSLVIDPILAWAPDRMAGVYLGGWQFEDRMVARRVSVPRHTRHDLAGRHGTAPEMNDVYGERSAASLRAWRDSLVRAPGRVADVAIELLRADRFDLVWLNFAAAHKGGHHLWDPSVVVRDQLTAEDERVLRDGLADVYAAVDDALARIVVELDGADIIVFSPTGMAANTSRADLLPEMLDAVLGDPASLAKRAATRTRSPIWALRAAIPSEWRNWLAGFVPDAVVADLTTRLYMRRDWTTTRAIAVPGENKGYIRVNLAGRERNGIVHPKDADALLDEIASGLVTFRDPDGSPAITEVKRTSALAAGSHAALLPDLVVHWGEAPATRLTHVTSRSFGDVLRRGVGSGRSGNHVDDAWAVLVPGASRVRDLGRQPRIADIGATACALLGADTAGLSGTSLFESMQ